MEKTIELTEGEFRGIIREVFEETQKIQPLFENSWNRTLQWIENHDIAIITAFRSELKDIKNPANTFIPDGEGPSYVFSLRETRMKNHRLQAQLIAYGFGVTSIHESYIGGKSGDDTRDVAKESFFCRESE